LPVLVLVLAPQSVLLLPQWAPPLLLLLLQLQQI
jgi:hypothetical protein